MKLGYLFLKYQNHFLLTLMKVEKYQSSEKHDSSLSSESHFAESSSQKPHLITQGELNDLVRDLELPKSNVELLGSRLQQWNLLASKTKLPIF